jgi:HPt (histidine-containing phosphotransfer) domain-containing protein
VIRTQHPGQAQVAYTFDPAVFEDLRALEEVAGQGFLAGLLETFVDETGPLLARLAEALDTGDAPAAGRIAHSIRGSCLQLGGLRLASSCERLETNALAGSLADAHQDLHQVEIDYTDLRRTFAQQVVSSHAGTAASVRA